MRRGVPFPTGRHLRVAVIGFLLSFALALTSVPAATAAPPQIDEVSGSGTVHASAAVKDRITFGAATLRAAKQSAKIARSAMSKSGKTLNYAKAKKVGGRTKWRRQFAAGFSWQGGRITHISKSELAAVTKLAPPSPAVVALREPNCRGENKTVVVRKDSQRRIVDTYHDSCETLDLIFARNQATIVSCGVGSGTVGLVSLIKTIPNLKQAIGVFAAFCVFFSQYDLGKLQKAVAKSTLSALIVRSDGTWHTAPKGTAGFYITVRYYPQ